MIELWLNRINEVSLVFGNSVKSLYNIKKKSCSSTVAPMATNDVTMIVDGSLHRRVNRTQGKHEQIVGNIEVNNLTLQTGNPHKRQSLREVIYLRNELQGWTTRKMQLERQFSALSIMLVLLISVLYIGAFSPPGGFVVTTVAISDKVGSSKNQLSNAQPGIFFFYCSSIGLAFAVLGMLFVLVYTLFPTMEGQVTKAINTFIAYVTDADDGMLGTADYDPVSITYQDAIINNITKTMNLFPMKYFIQAERRSVTLQKSWPVDHKVLFDEVLEFYRKCLPGELEICTCLHQVVILFLFVALLATIGAYISAILTPTTTFLGPPILMVSLIIIGTMIPLVILWRKLDFDSGARRHYDKGVEPIKLVFTL